MDTETETVAMTSVGVSRETNQLLDRIVNAIRPRPTKTSMLQLLIEQEAVRRGINGESPTRSLIEV